MWETARALVRGVALLAGAGLIVFAAPVIVFGGIAAGVLYVAVMIVAVPLTLLYEVAEPSPRPRRQGAEAVPPRPEEDDYGWAPPPPPGDTVCASCGAAVPAVRRCRRCAAEL